MGFIGAVGGPKKSEIVRSLGASFFGLSEAAWQAEISIYHDEEFRGEVDAVHKDPTGRYFVLFYGPEGDCQRFYLEEHGYTLPSNHLLVSPIPSFLNDPTG